MGDLLIIILGLVIGMCGAASFLVGLRRREWWPVLIGLALMWAGATILT